MYGLTSRIPFPAQALASCLLFLLVGIAVVDDYGVGYDAPVQRSYAAKVAGYVLGDTDTLPWAHDRFYGMVFEIPLLAVERVLGLRDTRAVYLSRHVLTHFFFLASAFFCALLAYRMGHSRWTALFALLLLLSQPRLYAHSFFNTKDVPFLGMFVICLFLVHRAFRKDTVGAFVLCGMGIGLLGNVRIMGLMLLPAVAAMRALDFCHADGPRMRTRTLVTAGAFVLAGALTLYASHPYLWRNPAEIFEALRVLAWHPNRSPQVFQGSLFAGDQLPPYYLPVWFAITTPPVGLLLGFAGIVSVFRRGAARPGDVLRNTELRFEFLLVACLLLPVLAVMTLGSVVIDGWRQMYFLLVPFSLLGASGLHRLALVLKGAPSARPVQADPTRYRNVGRAFAGMMKRRGVYAAAAIGVGIAFVQMIRIHPWQHDYFNFLVDRTTPNHLRTEYEMDYWALASRGALEYLLQRYPDSKISVRMWWNRHKNLYQNHMILPEADRKRIVFEENADFEVVPHWGNFPDGEHELEYFAPVVHTHRIYGNTLLSVLAADPSRVDEATADTHREAWRRTYERTVSGKPAARAGFDVYFDAGALTYVKEPCAAADLEPRFFLSVLRADANGPVRATSPPQGGTANLDFLFNAGRKIVFEGKCLVRVPLPGYARRVRTGQFVCERPGFAPGACRPLGEAWSAEFDLPAAGVRPDGAD